MILKIRTSPLLDGKAGFFKVFFTSGFQGHPDPNEWPNKVIHPDHGSFKVDDIGETEIGIYVFFVFLIFIILIDKFGMEPNSKC